MDDEKLASTLNEIFDIEGAKIEKKQSNVLGRWLFTVFMTLFALGVAAVCVWGANYSYGSLRIFLYVVIDLALIFMLFRLWLAFAVDVKAGKHAETVTFLRDGKDRYYYTAGRHVAKFEYARGYIAVSGGTYDKFEDKTDYSPLAGRYNKSLQRRSSLYTTMSPAFWYDLIRKGEYEIGENSIKAGGRGYSVVIEWDNNRKIHRIDYLGDGYYLYDSVSPIKIMDCKLPGKYAITYDFTVGKQTTIELEPVFGTAMDDFLMLPPPPDCAVVLSDEKAQIPTGSKSTTKEEDNEEK